MEDGGGGGGGIAFPELQPASGLTQLKIIFLPLGTSPKSFALISSLEVC